VADRPAADRRVVRRGALVLAASLLLGACGSGEESTLPVAGVAELQAPYMTEPYRAFDENLIRSVEEACAESLRGAFRVQPTLVLADGRGGDRLMLLYGAGPGETAECLVRIDANGAPTVDSAGSSGTGPAQLGPLELQASAGGSASGVDSWSYLHGLIGSDIGGVVIALADGTSITASVGGGRFVAWWPGEAQPTRFLGFDRAGTQVANQPY
jgi:hypothetical protein